eukprot:CAMPEP_0172547996 /NCGR_PEP_ID=MMETSP1067-20121228/17412_1 /TAXON_ID=265564 ORGANISM="Thalassiosira punctigera, Strain Tpunct2005C2" /NCGR_SAMPLE_ID=MMETSP1067 /ASSEMBLY_ACC=CAM_ASM_000444 /LENGTH=316 /DNA_ID=CAMNT_0013335173 /DNA_START=29 /DNA_END=982 /DNA_ORIENTATION=-
MASNQNRNKAAGAVSSSIYGAISTSSSDLWMIRLPNRLAAAWEEAPEGTVLGTLTFTKGGGANGARAPQAKRFKTSAPASSSKISLTIDPNIAESQSDLPENYTLEAMTKKLPALHPFTRGADGGVSIHGKISRTASAQVAHGFNAGSSNADDSRYKNLLKKRLLDTSVNSKRFVQPGGDAAQSGPLKAATAAASLGTGFGGSVAQFGKNMLDAKERAKGFGMPEMTGPPITGLDGVRSALFDFFSKRTFWAVKDLRLASGGRLPERETREVLRDIAEYHRMGEHKNTWELKSEFKSAVTSAAASKSGAGGQAGGN